MEMVMKMMRAGKRIFSNGVNTRASWIIGNGRRWMSSSRKNAKVMSFGDGSHGALGLPTSLTGIGGDAYEPTAVPFLPFNIDSVSAGHYHSLAVDSEGKVWAWGRDNEAQLGRGLPSPRDSWNEPKRVIGLDQIQVCNAFASGVISAAIGDDGSLWVWGKSKRGQLGLGKELTESLLPSRVDALAGEKIVKVSFGWGHALARSEDGKLFGWGYHADGRIGRVGAALAISPLDSSTADGFKKNSQSTLEVAEKMVQEGIEKEGNMPIIWEPRLVEEVNGVEVIDIACGLDHSLVLCRDGKLLSCGSSVYSQLGRVNQDLGLLPLDISFCPVSIAAGLGHSLAICQDGSDNSIIEGSKRVVSWGWNKMWQLGREGPEQTPLEVEGLDDGEIPVSVSGGRAHSIVLTSKGEVWVWGSGKNGRLGLGSSCDEVEPCWLDSLEGLNVVQAVSGFDHNLVLVAD